MLAAVDRILENPRCDPFAMVIRTEVIEHLYQAVESPHVEWTRAGPFLVRKRRLTKE
jgi:hypothetical protein